MHIVLNRHRMESKRVEIAVWVFSMMAAGWSLSGAHQTGWADVVPLLSPEAGRQRTKIGGQLLTPMLSGQIPDSQAGWVEDRISIEKEGRCISAFAAIDSKEIENNMTQNRDTISWYQWKKLEPLQSHIISLLDTLGCSAGNHIRGRGYCFALEKLKWDGKKAGQH